MSLNLRKIDIEKEKNAIIEVSFGYRSGIIIEKKGDKITVSREKCVPCGEDDIDSDWEELGSFNI